MFNIAQYSITVKRKKDIDPILIEDLCTSAKNSLDRFHLSVYDSFKLKYELNRDIIRNSRKLIPTTFALIYFNQS